MENHSEVPVYVTIRIPLSEKERWRKAASDRGMSMTGFLRVCVTEAVGARTAKSLASAIAVELGPLLQSSAQPVAVLEPLVYQFQQTCDDVDFHVVGSRCSTCGGSKW